MTRKDVPIRGVDESVYSKAKAAAASKGITLGKAVEEALAVLDGKKEEIRLRSSDTDR